MESNQDEARKAKENAERRFAMKDFLGAKNYALKAQTLFPELDGIDQMVATFDIYVASETKVNGDVDLYSVLGLKPSADRSMVKKQYKRLAVLLHPDKNRTVGADGAFKLVSEAWSLLSDNMKRASYDLRRNGQLSSAVVFSQEEPPTFWTVCTSCQVQYEYLRKYVNKRLSCKNCRGTFMAAELGTAPVNGSYPVCQWPYAPDNGYGGPGYSGGSFFTTNGMYVAGNGASGYHSGHSSEYVSNVSFQWGTCHGASAGYVDSNGLVTASGDTFYHANGYSCKPGKKIKGTDVSNAPAVDPNVNSVIGHIETASIKVTRPYKKRKVEVGVGGDSANANEVGSKVVPEAVMTNVNGNSNASPKFCSPVAAAFDVRGMLIEKARMEIRKKLEEMRLAAEAEKNTRLHGGGKSGGRRTGILELNKNVAVTLTVPDSDFHDFDRDRAEECFKPKQIWALYDEEDGMPRLYCLIREVISVKPFKIHISYLSSKTDTEFGVVNWINSGFTKSCGSFRACNADIVEEVNMFSHLLSREKAGRGGCVRIYPKCGDIWALYRNWSPDWNRRTPYQDRHQYDMVEVLDDYSEEFGVCVIPLIKLDGFKTVYRRNRGTDAMRWIPRREMVRFSHQVPSWFLKEVDSLPDGCWDLDPAATPQELLQAEKMEAEDDTPSQADI